MQIPLPVSTTVLLGGASGMLGHAIATALKAHHFSLLRLVRHDPQYVGEIPWNPAQGTFAETAQLERIHAAIHLSGASIAGHRWTSAYKRQMADSRIDSTRLLSETLARLKAPPKSLIVASAIGFYGDRADQILDESSPAGYGFFPELCQAWEAASQPATDAGIRVVHLRFGLILGPHGGAMARLAPLFRWCLGGPLGNGQQWMSWISLSDAVSAALFAMDAPTLSGPVNAVSPSPATNAEFSRALGRAVHRPAFLPAPAAALRLAFGQMADDALLASTRVLPNRLLEDDFHFQHPTLPEAFAYALRRQPAGPSPFRPLN